MIVAFSVQPTGTPSDPALARDLGEGADAASVHDAVAAAVKVVRDSGLPARTSAMFTEIEGEWDEVMDVVRRATAEAGRYGSRVSLVLKADIRPGYDGELDGKVARMEQALGELDGCALLHSAQCVKASHRMMCGVRRPGRARRTRGTAARAASAA